MIQPWVVVLLVLEVVMESWVPWLVSETGVAPVGWLPLEVHKL